MRDKNPDHTGRDFFCLDFVENFVSTTFEIITQKNLRKSVKSAKSAFLSAFFRKFVVNKSFSL